MNVGLLVTSFWRAIESLLDEVRRTPTWIVAVMLFVVITGTLVAQLVR